MANMNDKNLLLFQENGVVVINNIFTQKEISEIREACNADCVKEFLFQEHSGFSFHWLELTTKHPTFMKFAKHEKIINLIEPILGKNIQLQHSKLAVKLPGKGKGTVNWHQDFAYFPHTNTSLVAVMIALDNINLNNGGMQVIKGSHKLGLQNHLNSDGTILGNCNIAAAEFDASQYIDVCPNAGGVSIHHCLAIHKSEDNLTSNPRRAIVFEYRADDAYQLADGIWADTGILISGQYQGVVRVENGQYRLPRGNRYGKNFPFGQVWNQFGEIAKNESSWFK